MSQPVFLTKPRTLQALALAEPAILALMNSVTNNKSIHIVILDPSGNILLEQTVGPNAAADKDRMAICTEIARSKAQIHFRTGRPSAEIQARRPHALTVGDTLYGGSADHQGLIVAASGVQSHFDESIAATVAAILWGLCVDAQFQHFAKPSKPPHYQQPL